MEQKNLDELIELTEKLKSPIIKQLEFLGSTEKTIDAFFEKEEILVCPSCCTFNFREIYYDKIKQYKNYQCNDCLHTERKNC